MNSLDFSNAFKALNEDVFDADKEGIAELSDFMASNDEEVIPVIDPEAETIDDVKDSYIGKAILDCNVCHSLIYKDKEDIHVSDDEENVNIDEECPFCYSTDGFKIVGEVCDYCKECDEEEKEEPEEESETEVEVKETEEITESVKSKEALKESYTIYYMTGDRDTEPKFKTKSIASKDINKVYKWISDFLDFDEPITSFDSLDLQDISDTPLIYGVKEGKDLIYDLDFDHYQKYKRELKRGVSDDFTEALKESTTDLTTKENTIANVLKTNMGELAVIDNAEKLKSKVIEILDKSEIKDKKSVERLKKILATKKSTNALLSTIATFMTGMRSNPDVVEDCHKVEECDMTECDMTESDKPAATSIEDAQKWVDYDMEHYHKISERTNELVKKAGFQIVKDDHGDYEVTAGKYDEELKEDFKEVKIETDDTKMEMTSDDEGKVVVTTEPIKEEDKEEIEQTIEPFSKEEEKEIIVDSEREEDEDEFDVEEFDEESFDDLAEQYLTKVYDNVKSYKTSAIHEENGQNICEGVITFDSGANKKTTFAFNKLEKLNENKFACNGENKELCRGKKAFTLSGKLEEKKFKPNRLTYNYRVKSLDESYSGRIYGTVKNSK